MQDMRDARHLMRVLISSGLVGDKFAESLLDRDPSRTELSEEHQKLFDHTLATAQRSAREILDAIDQEVLDCIVQDSLHMKEELVGDQAAGFFDEYFEKHVDADARKKIEDALQGFLRDPLVKEATEDSIS